MLFMRVLQQSVSKKIRPSYAFSQHIQVLANKHIRTTYITCMLLFFMFVESTNRLIYSWFVAFVISTVSMIAKHSVCVVCCALALVQIGKKFFKKMEILLRCQGCRN